MSAFRIRRSYVILAALCVACGLACARAVAASDDAPGEAAAAPTDPAVPPVLTLRECILRALAANKDIRIADVQVDISEAAITGAEGAFDLTVFAEASAGRTEVPVAGVPLDRVRTRDSDVVVGLRKRLVTGTDVSMAASNAYSRDLTGRSALNPLYGPEVTLGISQDLLKDFGVDINRTHIVLAANNHLASLEDRRQSIMANLLEVEQVYWELYYATADLAVREQQRARAESLVRVATRREQVGPGTKKDISRAEASAAAQSVAILNAENRVQQLRHRLLRLMGVLDELSADVEFSLGELPPYEPQQTSLAEAMAVARRFRPDYRQAELAIDNAELRSRFARNQTLPRLQAFVSYSLLGLDDSLSGGIDHVRDADYDSWRAGLRFEVPFPNRTARSEQRVAALERRIAALRRDAALETITRDVADALQNLQTAEGRIESARRARELARDLLNKETRAYEVGDSDSTDVLDAQAALANAERDEVGARTDYVTALAALWAAQGDLLERKGISLVEQGTSSGADGR
ncbi:MAG: TolC family protein [Candidatus Brocadiaceae bacterium]|nr:TolC family protein [Candidatus Brocadiaceae bacterium]